MLEMNEITPQTFFYSRKRALSTRAAYIGKIFVLLHQANRSRLKINLLSSYYELKRENLFYNTLRNHFLF